MFNLYLMQENFKPAPSETPTDVETWLEKTNYTRKEKDALLQELIDKPILKKKHELCKCFIKQETYPQKKALRPIKSTTDRFKVEVGPWFQIVNEVLFKHHEFIKKIPIDERPKYIMEKLGQFRLFCTTDYSKFESHFTELIMMTIEMPFYEYCVQNIPGYEKFMNLISRVLPGRRKFVFKYFLSEMNATRASGEMCTSSGNGYTNFFVFHYLTELLGATKATGVFEGDDGLTGVLPEKSLPRTEHYEWLGFNCKIQNTTILSEASFCGLIFDPVDQINVCDIRATVADLGWTSRPYIYANDKTKQALLRAKGYSLVYQYRGCPVLDSIGHCILRLTDEDNFKQKFDKISANTDTYRRNLLKKAIEKRPSRTESPINTRLLVDKLFGVSVEKQKQVEKYFDELKTLGPFSLDLNYPNEWYDFAYKHNVKINQFYYPKERKEIIDLLQSKVKIDLRKDWKL